MLPQAPSLPITRPRASSSTVTTDVLAEVEQAAAAAPAAPPFVWEHQWYPVLEDWADASRPHAVRLLGRDMVLWKDGDGVWRAADDACPHRLAPLSEGRVEEGRLHCAYHGWEFNGCGKCVKLPQAESEMALKTALASPRSAVRTYPTTVAAGLVFVWPDPEIGAAARAAAAQPPPVPTEVLDALAQSPGWYVRDLGYDHTFLLENLTDPAHLPVSHHGLAGLNRAKAKPVPMKPLPANGPGGPTLQVKVQEGTGGVWGSGSGQPCARRQHATHPPVPPYHTTRWQPSPRRPTSWT